MRKTMCRKKIAKEQQAFTLVELVITIMMAVIILFGVAAVMVDSQRGWRLMYHRVHGPVIEDAYVSRIAFDAVCRKSSTQRVVLGGTGESIEVYYYSDPLNLPKDANGIPYVDPPPDSYAEFRLTGSQLIVEHGTLVPYTWEHQSVTNQLTLANNVQSGQFSVAGSAVQMVLTLKDDRHNLTVTCSSVRHN